jgi:hypothetical protein
MIRSSNSLGRLSCGGVVPARRACSSNYPGAVAGSGIFVILLGLVAAALGGGVADPLHRRATVVLILIAGAPLLLITHALPRPTGQRVCSG